MTNAWACPVGTAAAGRPVGLRLRDAFLGTVAAGALSLAFAGPALAGPDACTLDGTGTIETCTGNQSAGVSALPVTTLNVNNLNQAIAPANADGISFFPTPTISPSPATPARSASASRPGTESLPSPAPEPLR